MSPLSGRSSWVLSALSRAGTARALQSLGDRFALSTRKRWPRLRQRSSPAFQILIYHRVHPSPSGFMLDSISPSRFEMQMDVLRRFYRVMPLDEILHRSRDASLPARAIAVTFDDGYRDNHTYAFPILRKYGISATVFLVTGCIGTGVAPWHDQVLAAFETTAVRSYFDEVTQETGDLSSPSKRRLVAHATLARLKRLTDIERAGVISRLHTELGHREPQSAPDLMLGWNDVREMSAGGIGFGSHTETHPILSRQAPDRAWMELVRSRETIQDRLQRDVTLFAYPNGKPQDYSDEVVEMVRRAGYECAVTTSFGANDVVDDPYLWKRGTPWEGDPAVFRLKLAYYGLKESPEQPLPGSTPAQHSRPALQPTHQNAS